MKKAKEKPFVPTYTYRLKQEPVWKNPKRTEGVTRYEKIPASIFGTAEKASKQISEKIALLIKHRQSENKHCVLGLVTGFTPVELYAELVELYRTEKLSFSNVHIFIAGEFYPIRPEAIQSQSGFIRSHLTDHIDIPEENIHFFDGTIEPDKVQDFCSRYEQQIASLGGIDIQLLGMGKGGHVIFNEPGSMLNSKTRLVNLDTQTKISLAADFFGLEHVPQTAFTLGISTILQAKEVIMMAWGEGKAKVAKNTIEGAVTDTMPTSFIQQHLDASIYLDHAASTELRRVKTPWKVGSCQWTDRLIRKAVVWLCQETGKSILKLTDRDYNDHGMSDLIVEQGNAHAINIKVFNDLQHTISGWPGGKPNADDTTRPERAAPFPKRVVLFSPHPDDDVISMGGTFARLVQQKHDVHVAYQTSGNIAVSDDDVVSTLDSMNEFGNICQTESLDIQQLYKNVKDFLKNKKISDSDSKEVRLMKGAIRRGEAKSACRYFGIPEDHIHFLDLPFYETGTVQKAPISECDVEIAMNLLQEVKPHQIYAAGDLSDPHGTHRVCMNIILEALNRLKNEEWFKECRIWLYRGAWQEWDIDQVDMAVPLSPEEVMIKRKAIYKHKSQNNGPMFPGSDSREFWQRAEDRNHATAVLYDKLGMAEYQAIEVFVRFEL